MANKEDIVTMVDTISDAFEWAKCLDVNHKINYDNESVSFYRDMIHFLRVSKEKIDKTRRKKKTSRNVKIVMRSFYDFIDEESWHVFSGRNWVPDKYRNMIEDTIMKDDIFESIDLKDIKRINRILKVMSKDITSLISYMIENKNTIIEEIDKLDKTPIMILPLMEKFPELWRMVNHDFNALSNWNANHDSERFAVKPIPPKMLDSLDPKEKELFKNHYLLFPESEVDNSKFDLVIPPREIIDHMCTHVDEAIKKELLDQYNEEEE